MNIKEIASFDTVQPGFGACYAIKGSVGPPQVSPRTPIPISCDSLRANLLPSFLQDFCDDVGIVPVMMMRRSTTVCLRIHRVSFDCLSASFGALEHAETVYCGSLVARCSFEEPSGLIWHCKQRTPKHPHKHKRAGKKALSEGRGEEESCDDEGVNDDRHETNHRERCRVL